MDFKEMTDEKKLLLNELANQINLHKQKLQQLESNFNQVLGQIQMLKELEKKQDEKGE